MCVCMLPVYMCVCGCVDGLRAKEGGKEREESTGTKNAFGHTTRASQSASITGKVQQTGKAKQTERERVCQRREEGKERERENRHREREREEIREREREGRE